MSSLLWPFFVLVMFAIAAVGALWGYRVYTTGDTSLSVSWLFPPRPEPRLGVMEQANVDGKRRLVLIRRDDVEHLIMTGGPVDVVIETNIAAAPRDVIEPVTEVPAVNERVEPAAPVFTRLARSFGQAVNK